MHCGSTFARTHYKNNLLAKPLSRCVRVVNFTRATPVTSSGRKPCLDWGGFFHERVFICTYQFLILPHTGGFKKQFQNKFDIFCSVRCFLIQTKFANFFLPNMDTYSHLHRFYDESKCCKIICALFDMEKHCGGGLMP